MKRNTLMLVGLLLICAGCSDEAVGESADAADTTVAVAEAGAQVATSVDASPSVPLTGAADQKLMAIPQKFRGKWDVAGEYACDEYSDRMMTVEAKGVQYFEGSDTVNGIEQVGDNTLKIDATYQFTDEKSDATYTLKLGANGKTLTMAEDGNGPVEYTRCEG